LTPLAVPLAVEQIHAAMRLHARLEQWQRADRALRALAERFPSLDADAVLLKVVAVNTLYGTRVFAFMRMAEHVEAVISQVDLTGAGPELVERVARLPPASPDEQTRRHHSFASKFTHFFIDAERFPILDSYAETMVRYHLDRTSCVSDEEHRYLAFAQNVATLKRLSRLTCSGRELDRYLWLAGQYHAWKRNPDAPMYAELKRLFAEPPEEAKADLKTLSGLE
jgi:hypothetical protein